MTMIVIYCNAIVNCNRDFSRVFSREWSEVSSLSSAMADTFSTTAKRISSFACQSCNCFECRLDVRSILTILTSVMPRGSQVFSFRACCVRVDLARMSQKVTSGYHVLTYLRAVAYLTAISLNVVSREWSEVSVIRNGGIGISFNAIGQIKATTHHAISRYIRRVRWIPDGDSTRGDFLIELSRYIYIQRAKSTGSVWTCARMWFEGSRGGPSRFCQWWTRAAAVRDGRGGSAAAFPFTNSTTTHPTRLGTIARHTGRSRRPPLVAVSSNVVVRDRRSARFRPRSRSHSHIGSVLSFISVFLSWHIR